MGEGGVGEWESGGTGEWESGRVGELGNAIADPDSDGVIHSLDMYSGPASLS